MRLSDLVRGQAPECPEHSSVRQTDLVQGASIAQKQAIASADWYALALAVPGVRDLFQLEGARWLYVLSFAFLGSCALTPIMVQVSRRWNLVDIPTERKIHVQPSARWGGGVCRICRVGADEFDSAGLDDSDCSGWFAAVDRRVIDDIYEVPASAKLVAQVAAAGIVIASGKVLTLFPAGRLGEAANMVLTLLWIVGITNAFNFFDGMDGLAAGLAILMAGFMGMVAFERISQGWDGWPWRLSVRARDSCPTIFAGGSRRSFSLAMAARRFSVSHSPV